MAVPGAWAPQLWGQGGQGWQERCPGAQRLRAHIPGDLCCPRGCGSAGSGQDPLPAGTTLCLRAPLAPGPGWCPAVNQVLLRL